jgi:hypothetical protein
MKIIKLNGNIGLQVDLRCEALGFLQRPLMAETQDIRSQDLRMRDVVCKNAQVLSFFDTLYD